MLFSVNKDVGKISIFVNEGTDAKYIDTFKGKLVRSIEI